MSVTKFLLLGIYLFAYSNLFSMQIFSPSAPEKNVFNHKWEFVSDNVMGGKSFGKLKINNDEGEMFYREFKHAA